MTRSFHNKATKLIHHRHYFIICLSSRQQGKDICLLTRSYTYSNVTRYPTATETAVHYLHRKSNGTSREYIMYILDITRHKYSDTASSQSQSKEMIRPVFRKGVFRQSSVFTFYN